jgi:tetratricopeptide (TPR) repeat protein
MVCPAKQGKDIKTMSVKTPSNFFIDFSLRFHAGFYQRLLKQVSSFNELGNRLVRIAEYERAFRRYDNVNEAAQLLVNLPLVEYQTIGQYYLGLCDYGKGIDPIETFEHVAETAPTRYRILAMQSLAAIGTRRGDHNSQLFWLLESFKIAPSIQSFRGIAILKAIEGNHKEAVTDFEKYLPLLQYAEPYVHYDFLNSYAVELGEVGRIQEARNICKVILESPFAAAYPEWRETANDLSQSSKSFVATSPLQNIPHNVLLMPIAEPGSYHSSDEAEPARILDLQKWKKRMGKGKKGNGKKHPEVQTVKDMMFRIMEIFTSRNTTDRQRRKMWEAVEKIASEPDASKPNDIDGA